VHIAKPKTPFAENFYYFKTRGYSIVAQTIMNIKKQFMDVNVGPLGSINDNLVLQKFNLYKQSMDHFSPFRMGFSQGIPCSIS
jgi:hypothetical protein